MRGILKDYFETVYFRFCFYGSLLRFSVGNENRANENIGVEDEPLALIQNFVYDILGGAPFGRFMANVLHGLL